MTDIFKSKENEFYIQLKEERFYIPGEDISGDVILDLKKASKTNNIKITLEGTVSIGGRVLTLFTTFVLVAESLDGQKSHYLEAHTHRFPFRITIPSPKTHAIPSTLEIPKLLKVTYKITAIYNKAFTLEKFCPTTSIPVDILEDINVEKAEFASDQTLERELLLTNETERKVKVTAIVKKRAAVKGDDIPISITIEHIGVMVRDKAITAQLLRSVYYGKNNSEIVGPKVLREVTSDIVILGPVSFTETFHLKLPIPVNVCPTVAESGKSFKIEYFLRLRVNLNEENPLYKESDGDIAIFNVPFIIGTYPKLAFIIDDDEDEEEQSSTQTEEIDAAEMDLVAETMKNMEIESTEIKSPVVTHADPMVQINHNENNSIITSTVLSPQPQNKIIDSPQSNGIADNSTLLMNNDTTVPFTSSPSANHTTCIQPTSPPLPSLPSLIQRQDSRASSLHRTDTTSSTQSSTVIEKQDPMGYSSFKETYPSSHISPETVNSGNHHQLGRQESVRWVLGQEKQAEPFLPTSIPSPQYTTNIIHHHTETQPFVMPTPAMNNTLPFTNSPPQNYTSHYPPQYNNNSYIPYPAHQHSQPIAQYPPPPPCNNNYSMNNGYYHTGHSYPLPQPDPMYPPPPPPLPNDNSYVSMPSHFSYQQPSYPYYNN